MTIVEIGFQPIDVMKNSSVCKSQGRKNDLKSIYEDQVPPYNSTVEREVPPEKWNEDQNKSQNNKGKDRISRIESVVSGQKVPKELHVELYLSNDTDSVISVTKKGHKLYISFVSQFLVCIWSIVLLALAEHLGSFERTLKIPFGCR